MIALLNEADYPVKIDGRSQTFEEALDERLASGWTILALELATPIPPVALYGTHPRWRAVLRKPND